MERSTVLGFSWEFLDEMTVWTVAITGVIAIVGGAALRSLAFAVGCLVAVGIDIALVRTATQHGRRDIAEGRIGATAPTLMLVGRLVAKALLLVLAIFVPTVMGFTGTVIGALAFDVTLVAVGSVVAGVRTMRTPREGR